MDWLSQKIANDTESLVRQFKEEHLVTSAQWGKMGQIAAGAYLADHVKEGTMTFLETLLRMVEDAEAESRGIKVSSCEPE